MEEVCYVVDALDAEVAQRGSGIDGQGFAGVAEVYRAGIESISASQLETARAIGFTREYPLHLWTYRLRLLQGELGSFAETASALAASRWG